MTEPDNDGKNKPKGRFWWFLGFALVFLVGMLLLLLSPPSRTYGTPRWIICANDLRGIGIGIVLYKGEHDDMPPPNLVALVTDDIVQPEMLICPSSGTEKSPTTQPADITVHCDYIYAPLPADAKGGLVMAFELPANHRQRIANVLFNDIHVEIIQQDMDRFVCLLQELNDYHAELRRQKP
ncbi:MAG: hypothetical protein KAV00_03380 [Phycisphaerae bacterium]|nr:hypothetical protein [Phycisphaerae bacterium]